METSGQYAIALGFFDGIHLGHQSLLRRTVERAEERGMRPAVFTFDRPPREVVTGQPVALLTTPEQRCAIIHRLFPIDTVIVAPFDREMMSMEWDAYLDLLVERFRAGWLVAGYDHRFGHKNRGTPQLLQRYCQARGLGCDIMPPVALDGVTVSSTYIRSLLDRGDVEAARRFLGHSLLV